MNDDINEPDATGTPKPRSLPARVGRFNLRLLQDDPEAMARFSGTFIGGRWFTTGPTPRSRPRGKDGPTPADPDRPATPEQR
jgi:hypothetical protein